MPRAEPLDPRVQDLDVREAPRHVPPHRIAARGSGRAPVVPPRPSSRHGRSARGWVMLLCWLGLSALSGHAAAGAGDIKAAALQSCPSIEEEIVDLDLLAEGLKNSRAVSVVEKLRLRTSIDGLIDRMKAYHDGAKHFSQAELQQQYDLLLMRIAAHLQHKDQVLHGRLCNAWEPIWRDLVDSGSFYAKFK